MDDIGRFERIQYIQIVSCHGCGLFTVVISSGTKTRTNGARNEVGIEEEYR